MAANPNVPSNVVYKYVGFKNEESYSKLRNIVKLMIIEDIKKDLEEQP